MPRIEILLDAIPADKLWRLEHADTGVVVIRTGRSVRAFIDRCPHAGWRLSDGELHEGVLECPAHGWEFSLETGRCLTVPDYGLVPVTVRSGGRRLRLEWGDEGEARESIAARWWRDFRAG